MAKKINFLLLLCAISTFSFGQSSSTSAAAPTSEQKKEQRKEHLQQMMKQEEEGALVYQKQNGFGIKLNNDGLSFFYEHGKYKTINKTNLWWVELGERHDPKEDRQSYQSFIDTVGDVFQSSSYIFGKINNCFYLKGGIGQQLLIGGKGNPNGIAVSLIYGGGLALALLKPYYLNVVDTTGQSIGIDIKYTPQDADLFLNPFAVNSADGFFKGLNEISVVPGLHARAALRFDYARLNRTLSAIEVGLNAVYYTKNIQIMYGEDPKKFFFTSYVAFVFGGRK